MSFTPDELRRAVEALAVIEERGNRDEWGFILRQAQDAAPSADPWGNAPIGARVNGELLAHRLATLLGAPIQDCEHAAAALFAPQRHRAIYDALVGYATELTGRSPPHDSTSAPKPIQRPAVRIVAEEGDAT